jgi:restriction system protein
MKWKMAENSLFAVLLRSPWWISGAVALGVTGLAFVLLPADYRFAGAFGALPFAGIALWRLVKEIGTPSASRVSETLERVRAMAWPAFADALEAGWRRDGYTVKRTQGAADFELAKEGRIYVVAARRWKAAHTGLEPLRELVKAKEAREAQEATWVTAGELTAEARAYAIEQRVRLLAGTDLTRLLR